MKNIKYTQVFAFSDKPGYGNPAGVVWGAEALTDDDMQEIARINNLSETAFVFPTGNRDIPYRIKFFTPAKPIPMCGHASIGSALVYWKVSGCPKKLNYSQQTDVGTLGIEIRCDDGSPKIYLDMDNPPLTRSLDEYRELLSQTLGIGCDEICSNLPVMLNEREYLYIPIRKLSTIRNMSPDFNSMLEMDKRLAIHGWYVFTPETIENNNFHCRFFAPSYGVDEDPVTGTANAYFAQYYLKYLGGSPCVLRVEQGYEIKKNGIVEIRIAREESGKIGVRIGGSAVSYIDGIIQVQ